MKNKNHWSCIVRSHFFVLLLLTSIDIFAQEGTENIEASSVAAISTGSRKSLSNKSSILVSKGRVVYTKFDLSSLPSSLISARLRIPVRSKSSGLVLIKKSSTKWSEKSISGLKTPALARRNLGRNKISLTQSEFNVNIKSILKEPGIYSFAIVGQDRSKVSIRTQRGKAFPYIELAYKQAENTPTPVPTSTPTEIPRVSGVNITRGPYLQRGNPSFAIVRWSTDVATGSAVYYGTSLNYPEFSKSDSTVTNSHRVEISGLSPDTTYYYRIGNTEGSFQTAEASRYLATSPTTGTDKATRIWVLGDSGTSDANARAVRDSYLNFTGSRRTDLLLMLGDNAYSNGTDSEYQSAVFDMYPSILKNTVLWPTLGNHDAYSVDSTTGTHPYYNIFSLPRYGEAGGLASGTEAYYSFDYGQIHFICLDSMESSRARGSAMLTWLGSDLAAAATATSTHWIIAFWHHPPYSEGSHRSDTDPVLIQMRENVLPILEDYGVDLVLSGHSHSYERSFFIDRHYGFKAEFNDSFKKMPGGGDAASIEGAYSKKSATAHAGSVYVVAGSSGQISEGSLNHPAMYTSLKELGSLVLDIDGNRLDAKFINNQAGASPRDVFTIIKNP